MPEQRHRVEIDGRVLSLSNLDKVLYPGTGLTKAGVIDYYRRVGDVVLPHLRDRPVTTRRFPEGVDGESFFEKRCPGHRPDWVRTATVPAASDGEDLEFCVVSDLPTLVWLANLAALELHVPMATARDPEHPTALVFDLDPGHPAGLPACARVAIRLREVLDRLGLEAVAKTSGKKGVHVCVPLNRDGGPTHATVRDFAHAVARVVERRSAGEVVTRMERRLRRGKVLIDWSQNARHKTTVGVYSLRATEVPAASTPLRWDEVAAARDDGDVLRFSLDETLARIEREGDLFAPVLETVQQLPDLPG